METGGLTAQLLSSFTAAEQTQEMSFHGGVLYLRDVKGGLEVIDLRDPRSPRKTGSTVNSDLEVTSQAGAGWIAMDRDLLGISVKSVSGLAEYEMGE
jgi:hypothetical protein